MRRRRPNWLRMGPFGMGLMALAVWLGSVFLPWDAYKYREARLVGLTEPEVVRLLGEPHHDSRNYKQSGTDPGYSLYYYGAGWMLYDVHFSGGRVDRVASRTK